MQDREKTLRDILNRLGYDFDNLSAIEINEILANMPTKLNRVPVLLTDEENQRVETEMEKTGETRSNVIRRLRLPPIKSKRGGKRPNAGRKAKHEESI